MSSNLIYEVIDKKCSVCGQHIWAEYDGEGQRFIKGIFQQDKKPTGWFLCACGFDNEEPKPKGEK